MTYTFEWFLWPTGQLSSVSDQFCVESARIDLSGDRLIVQCMANSEAEARVVGNEIIQKYSASLFRHSLFPGRLVSREEFVAMPAEFTSVMAVSRQERSRLRQAIRHARNELVAPHSELGRCYDYLQDAQEDETGELSRFV